MAEEEEEERKHGPQCAFCGFLGPSPEEPHRATHSRWLPRYSTAPTPFQKPSVCEALGGFAATRNYFENGSSGTDPIFRRRQGPWADLGASCHKGTTVYKRAPLASQTLFTL